MRRWIGHAVVLVMWVAGASLAIAGQAPLRATDPDVAISHRDRLYAAEQFSNTVSVIDPADNRLLGVIRLGDPAPTNFSPLYRGQVLVHGLGFSPDHRTLVVVSIGSNSVTFIDTQTNAVKHTTYVGRAPHEAFFTPDGQEVWVTIRGESHVLVLDATTYTEKLRIETPNGPGMQIFSPDGTYGFVCSSFTPETEVISVADHRIVGRIPQASPFCPNIAATPDGNQIWFTLKDTGLTQVFDAHPPFVLLETLETGPITNHVNFVSRTSGTLAYVTVGGLNQVQVFRTSDFGKVATIDVGRLPHGIWPSGDGSRMYVGLENDDRMEVIETARNKVIASIPIGQAPQAVVYVPNAVQSGTSGIEGLQPLGVAGQAQHLSLVAAGQRDHAATRPPTSVTLFDQGLVQVLEAAVSGLSPKADYVLGLARNADGNGPLEALADFKTNAAGAAIVNSIGAIRQIVEPQAKATRRFLVIRTGSANAPGRVIQVQSTREQSMEVPLIDGLIVLPTQHTVADILTRTISIAQTRGITVFANIDFSGDAARSQLTLRPTGLVILGNPAAGTPVMAAAPTTAIDLPLKILAFEDAEGHTWVGYNDPKYLQRRHGFSEALMKNLAPIGTLAEAVASAN
jgi:YVTN family beta-propeller protein